MTIALATAVVGGLIVLVTRSLLARHERVVAGRAAARLIDGEITTASSLIETSTRKGVWFDEPGEVISESAWNDHRDALARAPGFKGWYPVTTAVTHLQDIRRRARATGSYRGEAVDSFDLPRDYLGLAVISCEIASEALRAYAKTASYKSDRVAELQVLLNELLQWTEETEWEPLSREERRAAQRQGRKRPGKKRKR